MQLKTGTIAALLILSLFMVMAAAPAPATAALPTVTGETAVLMDPANGQLLYTKNPEQRIYPASTTKIITALIALESGRVGDMVTVPLEASLVEGSAIGLQEGELISLGDLIYGLMLNSGNDCAVAIACHLGGSVDGFVQLMNKKAAGIGAKNTHFNNPNGLPEPGHYSTARDMALIACCAMKNADFRDIVATKVQTIQRDDPEAQTYLYNSNKMLWNYDGAVGIKTGYTEEAGQCLVTDAVRDDRELISVVMKSEGTNIWSDSAALLDYGFAEFKAVTLSGAGEYAADAPVKYGRLDKAPVIAAGTLRYNFPRESQAAVTREAELAILKAPARAGSKAGELIFYDAGRELGRVDLLLRDDLSRKATTQWWFWLVVLTAAVFTVFLYLCFISIKRRRMIRGRRKYYYY